MTRMSRLHSALSQEKSKKKMSASDSSFSLDAVDNDYESKEASREVSPEILVNIKPFKEYMTNKYGNVNDSSIEKSMTKKRKKEQEKVHNLTNQVRNS